MAEMANQNEIFRLKNTSLQSEIDCLVKEKEDMRNEIRNNKNEYQNLNSKYILSQKQLRKLEEEKSLKEYNFTHSGKINNFNLKI